MARLVERKRFSPRDILFSLLNTITFFFTSMFGAGTMDNHTSAFAASRGRGGSSGSAPKGGNIKGLDKPASSGCASCGCSG